MNFIKNPLKRKAKNKACLKASLYTMLCREKERFMFFIRLAYDQFHKF